MYVCKKHINCLLSVSPLKTQKQNEFTSLCVISLETYQYTYLTMLNIITLHNKQ